MRLKYQLFLTLLLASGLVVATLYALNSWSFNRGFLSYINDTEVARLEPLRNALAQNYANSGGWNGLVADKGAWREILDQNRANNGRRSRGPGPRSLTIDPRLLLADASNNVLIGKQRPDRNVEWLTIISDGNIVGYLGFRQATQLPGQLDQVFARQQRNSFAYASLLMVALSAFLALLLASRIVKPILGVSNAVGEISRGKYEHRVPTDRSDELGDLSRDINQLAFALQNSLKARQEWIAEISHELRTPVAILQGELEALQDGISQFDRSAVDSLHAETLRLSRLINDLHDLSLSDVGALNYRMETVELTQLITERVNATKADNDKKGIHININSDEQDVLIMGDYQRLGQLFDNLLQNSLRYTDRDGEIRITLNSDSKTGHVYWMDSSPGVRDEQLDRLFEPLYRTEESRDRRQGGAGLGLAIAGKIVEAHQGKITASHASLGGLAIHIQLPLANRMA